MRFKFHRRFHKHYKKLSMREQRLVDLTIQLFASNPEDPKLRNRPLQGSLKGVRSITTGFDLRIHYIQKENESLILFLDVGSHSQLY